MNSTAYPNFTDPTSSAAPVVKVPKLRPPLEGSRLVKAVKRSDITGVQKALIALAGRNDAATVNDLADAIRVNNKIVEDEVKGDDKRADGKVHETGHRARVIDDYLRSTMIDKDPEHAVLAETVGGEKSASLLRRTLTSKKDADREAAAARSEKFAVFSKKMAEDAERLRNRGTAMAVAPTKAQNPNAGKEILNLTTGRAPSRDEVASYNVRLSEASKVKFEYNHQHQGRQTVELDAENAKLEYRTDGYSEIAGVYTDEVSSIRVTIIE